MELVPTIPPIISGIMLAEPGMVKPTVVETIRVTGRKRLGMFVWLNNPVASPIMVTMLALVSTPT